VYVYVCVCVCVYVYVCVCVYERTLLVDAVKENLLFANMSLERKGTIVDEMWRQEVKTGTVLIKQGVCDVCVTCACV